MSEDGRITACLKFCTTLLDERYSKDEYRNVRVCPLAVLGVKKSRGRWEWMGPDNYPTVLSKVIKIARFMVIQQTLLEAGPDEDESSSDDGISGFSDERNSSSSSWSSSSGPPHGSGCLALVRRKMNRYMVRGTHSAMQWMLDWMLDLRAYGLKIHYNTTTEGTIDWVGEQISWKGRVQFTMDQLREMVQSVINEARELLFQELMMVGFEHGILMIPWSALRDNPRRGLLAR